MWDLLYSTTLQIRQETTRNTSLGRNKPNTGECVSHRVDALLCGFVEIRTTISSHEGAPCNRNSYARSIGGCARFA